MTKPVQGKRILIVDDSGTMRMLLSMTVRKVEPGISTKEAENGLAAVDMLNRQKFDLVLTDIMMPEMNGLQLISKIRGALKSDIPIIIISTHGKEKDRDLGLSLGANDYVTKPVDGLQLKRIVSKYLSEDSDG